MKKLMLAVAAIAAVLGAKAAVKNVWYTVDDDDPVNGKNWSRVSGWSITGGTLGKLPGTEEIATLNSAKTTLKNGPLVISEGVHTPRAVLIANDKDNNYKKDGRQIWLKMTGGFLKTNFVTDSGFGTDGARSFSIGDHKDGYGVFTMEGGVVSNSMITVGYNGYGVMTNAGGTVYLFRSSDNDTSALTLGYAAGSTGILAQTSGVIESLGKLDNRHIRVGHNGYGCFDLLGGAVRGKVYLGYGATGRGEMTVGEGATVAGPMSVGYANGSYGRLKLEGGTLDIGNPTRSDRQHFFYIGRESGATGSVDYRSGKFLTARCFVGHSGEGCFDLNGTYVNGQNNGIETWYLGYQAGARGVLNLNAEFGYNAGTYGSICAGVYGDGEVNFNETMTIGYLKVAGGAQSCGLATLADGKTLTIKTNVNVGGYALADDANGLYPDLTATLDGGHGELRLDGGTLKLTNSNNGSNPLVYLGRYGNGFGRLTGFGTIAPASSGATNVRLGIGNGQVIADGDKLDLNSVVSGNCLFEPAADTTNGWYAVNGGYVRLPRNWFGEGTAAVSKRIGTDAETANLVGSVACTITPKASNKQNFVRCSLYAEDANTVKDKVATLPSKTVLGVWRAGVFTELDNATKREIKDISLTFHYDWTKLGANATSARVSLWRHDGTSWKRVGRATYAKGELPVVSTAAPLAQCSDAMNLGTFAVTKDPMGLLIVVE